MVTLFITPVTKSHDPLSRFLNGLLEGLLKGFCGLLKGFYKGSTGFRGY